MLENELTEINELNSSLIDVLFDKDYAKNNAVRVDLVFRGAESPVAIIEVHLDNQARSEILPHFSKTGNGVDGGVSHE